MTKKLDDDNKNKPSEKMNKTSNTSQKNHSTSKDTATKDNKQLKTISEPQRVQTEKSNDKTVSANKAVGSVTPKNKADKKYVKGPL